MSNILSVAVLCVLILLSSFFSASETAFTSASKPKLTMLADKKNKKASLVLKMLDKYDRLLSTILIGNNIVNIAATSIATILFIRLTNDDELGSTLATVVITIVVLVFGEVTPKSLAKEFPESFALFSVYILIFMSWLFFPLTFLFSLLRKLLDKMVKGRNDRRVTGEEILTIVEEACEEGGIDNQESELICSAIEFNDRSISEIITPRIDIIGIESTATLDEVINVFKESNFSRIPVYEGTLDNIIGVLLEKECFYLDKNADFSTMDHIKEPVFVSEGTKVGEALKMLQKKKAQMGVVIDEYGGTLGIFTVEDILEELVGEIWDEYDEIEEEIIKIDERVYKASGMTQVSKIFKYFDIAEDEETEASTLSGWAIEKIGMIPQNGEKFEYEGITFEALGSDPRKIEELLIIIPEKTQEDE